MSVRTIANNGPSKNRIDIVFLGDGYTSSELVTTYTTHAQNFIEYIFDNSLLTQPFGRYKDYFNVHLIDISSAESGADNPAEGSYKNTALNSTYYYDSVTERLLALDNQLADQALTQALAETPIDPDMKLVTVNSTKYGGAGGVYAVYAGGNEYSRELALHELAHSFANLADEYGGAGTYSGGEPNAVNVTADSSGTKWSHWLGYQQEGIGLIKTYEGGFYVDKGIWRPSENSKMRTLDRPFDAVSREAFILEFYKHVDPLDSYSYADVSGILTDVEALSVAPIDPDLIKVDWYVNGTLRVSNSTSITIADLGVKAGQHTISARAYDPTDWVRSDRSSLEQTVTWAIKVDAKLDARDDTAATVQNKPIEIDVRKNDIITGTISSDSFTQAENGVVTQKGDGKFIYTPDRDFLGADRFTYSLTDDSGKSDTATVIVRVDAMPDTRTLTPLADALLPTGLSKLRDFSGNQLGSDSNWREIGRVDVQRDGDTEIILVNSANGRWATIGIIEAQNQSFVDFSAHGPGGDTRVVGIYTDPLVASGQVARGGPFDSQTRFQNDLNAGRISKVLGAADYDGDGMQEVYFDLADNSAVLHAYMHADGNIRYANYQSQIDLMSFMAAQGIDQSVYSDWFA